MKVTQLHSIKLLALAFCSTFMISCSDDDDTSNPTGTTEETHYFVGVEYGTDPTVEVLANAESLSEGLISPIDNGYEQAAWMTYLQGADQIITVGYNTAPEYTSYELVNGELVKGASFFTTDDIYAAEMVDASTMVMISAPRSGFANKIIYLVNTDNMTVTNAVNTTFGDNQTDSLLAFPTDIHVRGSKLYISYYYIHARGDFSTPDANEANVAVFDYPSLTFDKIISDSRASKISRYYAFNGLVEDANGDIYTFSPSSIASGYYPVPENNSAILRIKNGETEFDPSFYIDFEAASGGLKINDMFITENGKAVVKATFEQEDAAYLWGNYWPASTSPLISTGILDLASGSYTALDNVPACGGGWNSAYRVEGNKVYLAVHNSDYSGIYVIDTETGMATEGADIEGNYAKGILALESN